MRILRSEILLAFLSSALGCEVVAGIHDLRLTEGGDDDGSAEGSPGDAGSGETSGEGGVKLALIDDLESNTGLILAVSGRSGAWFTYNDGTGTQSPIAGGKFLPTATTPARPSSTYAARTSGSAFTTWGAGMGFNLNDPPSGPNMGVRGVYDASGYKGFSFWARVGQGSATVRFNVPAKDTDLMGGVCMPATACSDYYGKTLPLTTEWVQYSVLFSDLHQQGWGMSIPTFDPKTLYAVQFKVDPNTSFDVWVDDIAFVEL